MKFFPALEEAEKAFKKKFSDKTKNKWENRDKFVAVPGKYTLLEMDDDDGDEVRRRARKLLYTEEHFTVNASGMNPWFASMQWALYSVLNSPLKRSHLSNPDTVGLVFQ